MKSWGIGNRAVLLAGLAAAPIAALAQAVDLTKLDTDAVSPRAQVLVLGTLHLRELPKDFDPAALHEVLERLAIFKPDIITIEALTGEECDLVARHPTKYGAAFCATTDAARAATGLEVPAAMAAVDKMLKAWPTLPAPAQRRRLASLFLAANDRASAYVQWLQLPQAERRVGDGLDAPLVDMLIGLGNRNDESFQIAAPLAARLGLQRVRAVDNHTGDNVDIPADRDEAFGHALRDAWNSGRAELDELDKPLAALKKGTDFLPVYRYVNEPAYLRALAEVNVRATMRSRSPESYPQMWVGGWEIRNLRMVANVRETFRERPGARVLSIVGASHKPWFDSWLGQLQGVDIIDAQAVLK
ncbi:MAG: hypothetical protein JO006_20850 [Paucibacter sp.]|nr:hypothetical protein [Roseateles sp.]